MFFLCLAVGKLVYCLWCINGILWQIGIYIQSIKVPPWMVLSGKIFKICACRFLRNAIPGPVLRFLCNFFSKLFLFLMDGFWRIHLFINKVCVAINLWELWSTLRWKEPCNAYPLFSNSVHPPHLPVASNPHSHCLFCCLVSLAKWVIKTTYDVLFY